MDDPRGGMQRGSRHVESDRVDRMNVPEVPLWLREILLGVALGGILVLAVLVWADRSNRAKANHQQICAIERYIIRRYKIDLAVPRIPHEILARRRAAILQLTRDAGVKCENFEAIIIALP